MDFVKTKYFRSTLFVALIIFLSCNASFADLGCNIGSAVYDGPAGTYPVGGAPNNELYNGTRHHIVTHSGDPVCGITSNMHNFTGKQCVVAKSGGGFYYGNVTSFTEQNINCPIDHYSALILIAIGGLSVKALRKRNS